MCASGKPQSMAAPSVTAPKEAGRLGEDALIVVILRLEKIVAILQLVQLAVDDDLERLAEEFDDTHIACLCGEAHQPCQRPVAGQGGGAARLFRQRVEGRCAAAQQRAVDDIVVHQRRGVQRFDRGRQRRCARS